MCKALLTVVFAGVLAAATCNANAQEGNIAAGHAFAREACKACHVVEPPRLPRRFEIGPAFRDIANTPGMTTTALKAFLTTSHPQDAESYPHARGDRGCNRVYSESSSSSLSSASQNKGGASEGRLSID